jgi:uncharacterized membrane protein
MSQVWHAAWRNILIALIYEVIGLVNIKFAHATVGSWEAVKGAPKAFISTLDSLPGSLTIERGNEAKRSSVELRSLVEGFCFLGSVSSVWRGTEWQPGNTPVRAVLDFCTCRLDQKARS